MALNTEPMPRTQIDKPMDLRRIRKKVRTHLLFDFEGPRPVKGDPLWGCSSAGRAPALQAGGQGFESLHLHQLDSLN